LKSRRISGSSRLTWGGVSTLKVEGINVYYGDVQVLWDASLHVDEGEIVALIGPNGAGKTTLLRTISGLLSPRSGSITYRGRRIDGEAAHRIAQLGISHVPEGRGIFTEMTVLENLMLGAFRREARRVREESLELVYKIFPVLKERERQRAGTLSGGEQQMLAIGRALMSRPKLLLLDEPSLGLAPIMVERIHEAIRDINKQGVTILMVEQNVWLALKLAGRAYIMERGRIAGHGCSKDLLESDYVKAAYLGVA
jgi:branched-chain amino acid transport system ATP-binding protein